MCFKHRATQLGFGEVNLIGKFVIPSYHDTMIDYDTEISADYCLTLLNAKRAYVQDIKPLPIVSQPELPADLHLLATQLGLSLVQLSIIATNIDASALQEHIFANSYIKAVLAQRAIHDHDSVLACLPKEKINGIRSLLYRLNYIDILKEYYRYECCSKCAC